MNCLEGFLLLKRSLGGTLKHLNALNVNAIVMLNRKLLILSIDCKWRYEVDAWSMSSVLFSNYTSGIEIIIELTWI